MCIGFADTRYYARYEMMIAALIIAVSKAYINPQKIVSNRATHNKIEYKNIRNDDIMSAKEKQAAAKQTFVFS